MKPSYFITLQVNIIVSKKASHEVFTLQVNIIVSKKASHQVFTVQVNIIVSKKASHQVFTLLPSFSQSVPALNTLLIVTISFFMVIRTGMNMHAMNVVLLVL
ncbi:hypothetical protein V1264_010136 [Littorina saxatilis]|uniref:Uncharacterized protein n=1 Tax=Littorina saxatilis TaxID=31220 RepID=A0AAN9ANX6_9CAEN